MLMKVAEVTIQVTKCTNCPFLVKNKYGQDHCGHSFLNYNKNLCAIDIFNNNFKGLTTSCPLWKSVIDI